MNALSYAHARGVIHRDIEPSNIMVGRYGEVMLIDWGIAKRVHGGAQDESAGGREEPEPATEEARLLKTRAGSLVGTPLYMSPEQARGQNDAIDERSDIYSLAVVIHEFFTLRHYLADKTTLLAVLDGIREPDRQLAAFVGECFTAGLPCEVMHLRLPAPGARGREEDALPPRREPAAHQPMCFRSMPRHAGQSWS